MSRCVAPKFERVYLRSIFSRKSVLFMFDLEADAETQNDEFENLIKTIEYVRKIAPALAGTHIIPETGAITRNLHHIKQICSKYNKCMCMISALERGTSLAQPKAPNRLPSKELYHHIIQLCYQRAVKNPMNLNKYGPFSPEVYGETSFELISLIIDNLTITKDDVFLDLGSGVGQVVLQMAALTPCKLNIGLEKNSVPSLYAENLAAYFQEWMRWYGKSYNPVKLLEADFLDTDSMEHFHSATIIFVNNVSFGPEINHQLTLRFQNLRDGVRIISPIPFCREKFRITGRSLNNIASIMTMIEIPQLKGPVSWTSKSVSYYVHVIDRRRLEAFFVHSTRRNDSRENSRKRWKGEVEAGQVAVNSSAPVEPAVSDVAFEEVASDAASAAAVERKGVEQQTVEKLNSLLDSYATDFLELVTQMKQRPYRQFVLDQIEDEKQRSYELMQSVEKLEEKIGDLEMENCLLLHRRWQQIYEDIANYQVNNLALPSTEELSTAMDVDVVEI